MESLVPSSWEPSVNEEAVCGRTSSVRRALTVDNILREAVCTPYTADDCLFDAAREKLLAKQTRLQKFTRGQTYESLCALLIVLNSTFIGIQTEYASLTTRDAGLAGQAEYISEPPAFLIVSAIFTLLFTIEFGVRWVSEGLCGLFRTNDASWNVFDIAIVTLSWIESFVSLLHLAEGKEEKENFLSSISLLRILRVARIVKLARVIRLMAFFRELRVMVYSILGSIKSLMWLTLILGSTFYIFGITFTTGTISYNTPDVLWNDRALLGLRESFGTLRSSILSLYMAISSGRSWGDFYSLLEKHLPPQYCAMFLIFLTFTIFAVLNIVTGVFVDLAMKASVDSRQVLVNEELEKKKTFLRDLRNLFHEMDENGDGNISYEEFRNRLADERVIAYFKALRLDVYDTSALFHLLDDDRSQTVDMLEFLNGCYQLQGEARSIDTKMIRLTLKRIIHQMEVLQCSQNEQKADLVSVAKCLHHTSTDPQSSTARFDNGSILNFLSNGHANGTDKATVADSKDPSVRRTQVVASQPQQRTDMLNEIVREDWDAGVFHGDAWDTHLHQILAVDQGGEGCLPPRGD